MSHTALEAFYAAALDNFGLPAVDDTMNHPLAHKLSHMPLGAGLEPQVWQFARSAPNKAVHLGQHFIDTFKAEDKLLLTQADAVQLEADGRRISALLCRDRSGRTISVRANQFVLACGCVETSHSLLQNKPNCPDILGPVENWLGRGFHQHLLIDAGEILTDRLGASRLQKTMNIFTRRPNQAFELDVRLTEESILEQHLLSAAAMVRYESRAGRALGEKVYRGVTYASGRQPAYFNPRMSVELSVEQAINPNNAISLGSHKDINGQLCASLHWEIGGLELRCALVLTQLVSAALASNSMGKFEALASAEHAAARPMRDSLHHMGGTQMSEAPGNWEVDPSQLVHGAHNLSIVGASVFPTGGHVNPTLTIIALAMRLAAKLNDM